LKHFRFKQTGEPLAVLTLEDAPTPTPGDYDVLVRMLLAPIHPSDLHVLRGRVGRQPQLPATPGLEDMGEIEAIGSSVKGLSVGTRVVLLDVPGSWSTHVVAPAERVVPVPDNVSNEDAAQALVNPVTAIAMTIYVHKLKSGDTLLQSAASSVVGQLVLQIAKANGFRTINLVRRAEQTQEVSARGGDVVICTADDDWQAQVLSATEGRGVLSAIDCVAGEIGAGIARCLAPGGRLLVFGALSSHRKTELSAFQMPVFSPNLIYKATTVEGWFLPHWLSVTPLSETRATLELVLRRLSSHKLRLPAAVRHPLSALETALREAESTQRQGKPLLDFTTVPDS
jgi:NADPH:quinone reductase-like Zn-dependent oxidoreductase